MVKKVGYIQTSTFDQQTLRQLDGVEVDKTFIDQICSPGLVTATGLSEVC